MLTAEKIANNAQSLGASRNIRPMILVAAVAVLCGFLGVWLKFSQRKPAPEPPVFSVPVAVRDLEIGRVVQSSDFYQLRCTAEELKQLPEKNFYSQGKEIVGRIVQSRVPQGHPFGLHSLFAEGTGPSPVDNLEPGFRGVTVGVKLVGGVRGFASPNAWVDVLFRRDDVTKPRSIDEARTHTLFHSVRVLAVEDQVYPDSQLPRDKRGQVSDQFEITLALTPDQAEIIKTLEGRGTLSLSLLPPEPDRHSLGDVPHASILDMLLGVVKPESEPPAPPVADRVELFRGGQGDIVEMHPDQAIAPAVPERISIRPHEQGEYRHIPAPPHRPVPSYYGEESVNQPMGASIPGESVRFEVVYVRTNRGWSPTHASPSQRRAPAIAMTNWPPHALAANAPRREFASAYFKMRR